MAKKKNEKDSPLGTVVLWTLVLALTFSAGLITGQRLLRRENLPPLVSVRKQVAEEQKPSLKTEFSFYKTLTTPELPDKKIKKAAKVIVKKIQPVIKEKSTPKPVLPIKEVVKEVMAKAKDVVKKNEKLPAKYTLQLSSHPTKSQADKEMKRLKEMGHNAHLVSISIPDRGRVFRVRIGKFHSMDEARNFQGVIKAKGGISSFVTPL